MILARLFWLVLPPVELDKVAVDDYARNGVAQALELHILHQDYFILTELKYIINKKYEIAIFTDKVFTV